MSFYYNYKIMDEYKTVSVYKKDGKYHVVGGRNIYGYDDEYSDKYLENIEDDYFNEKRIFIKTIPYESEYHSLNERLGFTFEIQNLNKIYFVNNYDTNYDQNHFTISVYNNEDLKVNIMIKTYDTFKNEINSYNVELDEFHSFTRKINKLQEKYIKIYIVDNYE